jgi:hypothetical protein
LGLNHVDILNHPRRIDTATENVVNELHVKMLICACRQFVTNPVLHARESRTGRPKTRPKPPKPFNCRSQCILKMNHPPAQADGRSHRLSDKGQGFSTREGSNKRDLPPLVVILTNLTESFDLRLSNKNHKNSSTRGSDFTRTL